MPARNAAGLAHAITAPYSGPVQGDIMAASNETSGINHALAVQSEILSRPMTGNRRMADAIRALAIDAVEKS